MPKTLRETQAKRRVETARRDRHLIVLGDERYAAFLAALDAPAEPTPQLKKLLATPAPWEK